MPAAAFQVTYIADTNETLGGSLNKQVAMDFGFRVSAAAVACGIPAEAITSVNGGGTSRFVLSNGKTYNGTNGLTVPADGTVGTTDTSCRSGLSGTEACGTSGQSPYALASSTSTNSYHVTAVSLYRSIKVDGYGTTVVYLNGSGFGSTPNSSDLATTLSVTSSPAY